MADVKEVYAHLTDRLTLAHVICRFKTRDPFDCRLEVNGPFLYFSSREFLFTVFVPNFLMFTPMGTGPDTLQVTLESTVLTDLKVDLTFSTTEELVSFQEIFLRGISAVSDFVRRVDFRKYQIHEQVQFFNARTRCWQQCAAILQVLGAMVLFQTHILTGDSMKGGLSLPISRTMVCDTQLSDDVIFKGTRQTSFILWQANKPEERSVFMSPQRRIFEMFTISIHLLIQQAGIGAIQFLPLPWEVVEYDEHGEEDAEEAPDAGEAAPAAVAAPAEYEYEYEYEEVVEEVLVRFEDDEVPAAPAAEPEPTAVAVPVVVPEDEDEEEIEEIDEAENERLLALIETGLPCKLFANAIVKNTIFPDDHAQFDRRLEKRRRRPTVEVRGEEFSLPVFEPVVRTFSKEIDILALDVPNFDVFSELPGCEEVTAEQFIGHWIEEYESVDVVKFDTFFPFEAVPQFPPDNFDDLREPNCPYFIDLLSAVNDLVAEEPASVTTVQGARFVSLVAALFVNGLRSDVNFLSALGELSDLFGPLRPIVQSVSSASALPQLVVSFVVELLNRGIMKIVLRQILRTESWSRKYFRPSSLIRYGTVLETVIQQLDRLRLIPFALAAAPSDLSNLAKYSSAAFHFVEVDQPDVIIVDFILQTFDNGAQKGIVLGNRGFEFVSQVCDQNITVEAPDLREFVDIFVAIRGDSVLSRRMNQEKKLRDFVETGLEKRKLHIWFLFMVVNTQVTEQFYEEDASLRDLFRAGVIVTALYRMMKTLG
jgi:hypothetical protein